MATSSRAVLRLTHSADHVTIDRVQAGVARRGASPIRFDTDRFPEHEWGILERDLELPIADAIAEELCHT